MMAEAQPAELLRQANRDLAQRGIAGCWGFTAMTVVVWVATDCPRRDPELLWAITVINLLLTGSRLVLIRNSDWFGAAAQRLWRGCLSAVYITGGGVWGLLSGWVITSRGFDNFSSAIFVVLTVGIATGVLHATAPSLPLMTAYILALLTPGVISSLWVGGFQGFSFASVIIVYTGFMLTMGRRIHTEYWGQLTSRELLRVRAEELARAKDAAEAADRAKSRFLANISHELRTPMNGVIGMTSLVLETPLDQTQKEMIEVARSSANSLLSLLNELLDLAKIEAGRMEMESVPVDVRRLVGDAVKSFYSQAIARKIELRAKIDPAVPAAVESDPLRLRQVLVNLIGNAIKFTHEGSVTICVSREIDLPAPDSILLRFDVCDTGIGIPFDKQSNIFEAFAQADASTTRRYGGTGLGLAIAARILNLLGGRIWLESEPGKGSTFSFNVPVREGVAAGHDDTASQPVTHAARPLRVLLAEDNPVNQIVAVKMLESWGHSAVIAPDGMAAIREYESARFDVVLMDVHMPDLSGLEATRRIRALESVLGVRTPVVAMTASAMKEDRQACLEAGMDDYLSKPVAMAELKKILDRIASMPAKNTAAVR
jgi:signal transduction histidine kinase/ActR/RegA family two-component response regulator